MKKDSGGAAFPKTGRVSSENRRVEDGQVGMTLRDYFAAKAMAGICSHKNTWGCGIEEIGTRAYQVADSMIAARNKP